MGENDLIIVFIGMALFLFWVWHYNKREDNKLKSLIKLDRSKKMNVFRDVDDRVAIKLFESNGKKWKTATAQQREDFRDMAKIAFDEIDQLNHEWGMGKLWADAAASV